MYQNLFKKYFQRLTCKISLFALLNPVSALSGDIIRLDRYERIQIRMNKALELCLNRQNSRGGSRNKSIQKSAWPKVDYLKFFKFFERKNGKIQIKIRNILKIQKIVKIWKNQIKNFLKPGSGKSIKIQKNFYKI